MEADTLQEDHIVVWTESNYSMPAGVYMFVCARCIRERGVCVGGVTNLALSPSVP